MISGFFIFYFLDYLSRPLALSLSCAPHLETGIACTAITSTVTLEGSRQEHECATISSKDRADSRACAANWQFSRHADFF